MNLANIFKSARQIEEELRAREAYEAHMATLREQMMGSMIGNGMGGGGLNSALGSGLQNQAVNVGALTQKQLGAMLQNAAMNYGAQAQPEKGRTAEDLNNDPAYGPPLTTIIDLWLARWGDGWVAMESIQDEGTFWQDACNRLQNANRIEHLRTVCAYRIIP